MLKTNLAQRISFIQVLQGNKIMSDADDINLAVVEDMHDDITTLEARIYKALEIEPRSAGVHETDETKALVDGFNQCRKLFRSAILGGE